MFRKRVLSGVCVLLIVAAGGLLVADSSEDVEDESEVDIRVRCAAKALEIARLDFKVAVYAKKAVPEAVPDADFERLRLTVEIAELRVEKLRSELAYESRLAEMEARRAADKADAAGNRVETLRKAPLRRGHSSDMPKHLLQSELAALELECAKRQLESQRIFRRPSPGSLEAEDQ